MKLKWVHVAILIIVTLVLTGCGKTVDEQVELGITSAETVFKDNSNKPNKTIGEIQLFVPSGYSAKESEDLNNLILTKGKDQYLLFVNEYEKQDSKLHYELLKKDSSKKVIKEETIESDGAFGFAAVIEVDEDHYELITSSGGAKISTISEDKKIDEKLANMMAITRSVELID
ncbi:hypothetical protein SAMN05880501_103247 [Ureibacillus xyleni]|uniref:Uncharacterized protein n=1 Tax=Ureibacillus xyleni TaxID=614648 RepID=A0A285S881_9BACL|nr:hypothetical protein [Ureibacillus xyleni]SOC03411.1 hypothetical protein SAMN05880501_103247 [Ureibacillus xyleni]